MLKLEDSELGGYLQITTSHPLTCRAASFHTVSQSEAGFEQIMQACLPRIYLGPGHATKLYDPNVQKFELAHSTYPRVEGRIPGQSR
ncbi:MAG: DUF1926 domain-containing protein [Gammaproteobacteria bacterium]|nr:DUF1926 domain-containing protein [Gammaproteobacteria bacterium]